MYGLYGYDYGYRSSGVDTMAVLSILAVVLAVVGTVLLMILVTPEKRRAGLNKFFRGVADICNFKGLLLEYIVRALYIFLTLLVVVLGFFTLFVQPLSGLLLMILGPIVLRIYFELIMMFILLVKNVIQINNKIPGKAADPMKIEMPPKAPETPKAPEAPAAPVAPTAPEANMVFCAKCGTRYDSSKGGCPNGCTED